MIQEVIELFRWTFKLHKNRMGIFRYWFQLKYLYLLYSDLEVLLCLKQKCYHKEQRRVLN